MIGAYADTFMPMKIVIVMPAYNEFENLDHMIYEVAEKEFRKITEAEMFLVIVDDCSPIHYHAVLQKKSIRHPNVHILEGEKAGLGRAVIKGMKFAMQHLNADAIIEMDADFQHDPIYIEKMVKIFLNGADYVIGSRYISGGTLPPNWPLHRKFISFFGNHFARLILGIREIHDVTTGLRLTRAKNVLDKIDLDHLMELNRFAYKVDLLYRTIKLSRRTVEIPIRLKQRKMDKSKFKLKELTATLKVVVSLKLAEIFRASLVQP